MSDDRRTDRIGAALRGENPTVLRRLRAGFAVIGDVQFLPGYSVLLVDEPGVGSSCGIRDPAAGRPVPTASPSRPRSNRNASRSALDSSNNRCTPVRV
jgi:hypothetical protein